MEPKKAFPPSGIDPCRESPLTTLLPGCLSNFPIFYSKPSHSHMPIVQPHHRLTGLQIERDPAPLRSRILHDFNSAHDCSPSAKGGLRTTQEL
jgi:hypothetical protein